MNDSVLTAKEIAYLERVTILSRLDVDQRSLIPGMTRQFLTIIERQDMALTLALQSMNPVARRVLLRKIREKLTAPEVSDGRI